MTAFYLCQAELILKGVVYACEQPAGHDPILVHTNRAAQAKWYGNADGPNRESAILSSSLESAALALNLQWRIEPEDFIAIARQLIRMGWHKMDPPPEPKP